MADSLDEPHLKEAVERLRLRKEVKLAVERAGLFFSDGKPYGVERATDDVMALFDNVLSTSSARVKALEGERTDATSLARRAILAMARVQGMLEEGVRNAAILRTESVYVPAPMAREFIALAKALQEEDLGDARSTLTEAPGHE